jgi:hypothetical protein
MGTTSTVGGPVVVRPVSHPFAPDLELAPYQVTSHPHWPSFPDDWQGIVLPSTEVGYQFEVFHPTDPRLIAAHIADPPSCSSLVADMDDEQGGWLDPWRHARLNSALRVIKHPSYGLQRRNTLATNWTHGGRKDVRGGYVFDHESRDRQKRRLVTQKPGYTYAGQESQQFLGFKSGGTALNPFGLQTIPKGGKSVNQAMAKPKASGGAATHDALSGTQTGLPGNSSKVKGGVHFGGGSPFSTGVASRPGVIGMISCLDAGALDVGSRKDRHQLGEDADGNVINPVHVSTDAFFRRNDFDDGPLFFEANKWVEGTEAASRTNVHLDYDDRNGLWRWWGSTNVCEPHYPSEAPMPPFDLDIPPPPPVRPRPDPIGIISGASFGVGRPVQHMDHHVIYDGSTGPRAVVNRGVYDRVSVGREVIPRYIDAVDPREAMPFLAYRKQLAVPTLIGRPQPFVPGQDGRTHIGTAQEEVHHNHTVPVIGALHAYGAQGRERGGSGDKVGATPSPVNWQYAEEPLDGRYIGGTASGGFVLLPAGVDIFDANTDFLLSDMTEPTVHLVAGPGAYFGAGLPDFKTGKVHTGWEWYVDGRTLRFRDVNADGTENGLVDFEQGGLINIASGAAYKVSTLQVVTDRQVGWSSPSGSLSRSTFDTTTVTTEQLAERVAALIADLGNFSGHGLIGTTTV